MTINNKPCPYPDDCPLVRKKTRPIEEILENIKDCMDDIKSKLDSIEYHTRVKK